MIQFPLIHMKRGEGPINSGGFGGNSEPLTTGQKNFLRAAGNMLRRSPPPITKELSIEIACRVDGLEDEKKRREHGYSVHTIYCRGTGEIGMHCLFGYTKCDFASVKEIPALEQP